MKIIACILALAALSSCSLTVRPDGSKEANVDAATVAAVAKIIAEK